MALTRPKFSQFDTTISSISDPLTILNKSATIANIDVGFVINRNGGGVSNVALVWQESSSQFILAATSSNGDATANIVVTSYSNLQIGNVSATTVTSTNLVGAPNVIVTGSLLPSANITYDLGSPTQRWRSGYFSANTIYIGDESVSVDTNGTWSFTSKGSTVNMGKNTPFDAPDVTISGNVVATGNIIAANYNYANGVSTLATVGTIISTANTAMKGYVDGQITTVNGSISTANTALKGYADSQDSAITTAWTSNATTQLSQITAANAAIVTANTAMQGYVDGQITTVNGSISTANTALKGYIDGQITTVNSSISTANTALKGYADSQDSAITTAWTSNATTQLSQITAANAAIVTANTAMQGYVDGRFTTLIGGAPAILDTLNEIAIALGNDSNLSVTLTNTITTANTNMKGYADAITTAWTSNATTQLSQITAANAAIVTANTALKGYADAITTAWTSNATTLLSQIGGANAAIVTANTALKGYADAITTAWTSNATTLLSQIGGANAAIVTANTAMKGYTDGQITTVNSSISTANTALKGYTDGQITTVNSSISTANTALKGYVDSQDSAITTAWTSNATTQLSQITAANAAIVTANIAMQGYVDAANTIQSTQINTLTSSVTGANAAIVTANTALKGYTDGQLSSKANIDSQTFTGNVIFNSIGAIRLPSGTTAQRTTGTAGDFRYNSTTGGFEGYTTTWGSLAGGGGGTPGGADTQIQFNNSGSAFAGALSLHYFTGNGVVLANAGVASTSTTTGTLQVTGGIGATGNITAGNIIAGGVRQTIAGTVPSNPTVGDQWYDTSTDILFNFTYDGTNYVWVDISSAPINTALAGGISGTSLSISGVGSFTSTLSSGALTVPNIIHSGTSGTGDIGGTGAAFGTVFAKATSAQYADLAENYQADASYVPGTVIIFGGVNEVTISNISHDTAVAGVVSTNPAYLMNSKINAEYISAVALQGRVPCLVRGPINKGDLVVTSDIPGIAQRMDKKLYEPGCIIGKSLDAITANEIKTIEVVIGRF